ncbi:ABC transporter ATP-binding protein [Roseixanthobacter pseudopolyaromaticivorans]|uniref:ABC transporter ATP-binding protein n=1 Tax=Xanthobacteraceae TaxID=335928 RepID=UPI00372B9F77
MNAVVLGMRADALPVPPPASPAEAHILVDHVSKVYESDRGRVEALRDVSLKIRAGHFISIVGPSGCGKSTLMRCIAGLERPSSGGIILRGREIDQPPENLGMVFQRDVLLNWRTVLDNVLLLVEFRGKPRREWIDKARDLLKVFGLENFHNSYPWELSGGMRQRAAICRAMLDDPEILLMDEPFAALDAFTRDELNLELQSTNLRTSATTVFITHNIGEAIFLGDQVVVMDRRPGRIAAVIDIDLPRPRPLSVRETPEFAEYGRRIRQTFEDLGILRREP